MIGRTTRIIGIDALRGFAALAIAVYHCNALLELQRWPPYTGYLSMAVQLFFALSAFSLCVRYQGILRSAGEIAEFGIRRYLRIAPLFYVLILWFIGRTFLHGWELPSAEVLFLNLTFLFPLAPGKHESLVSAGWSLGIEMMFYALFPIVVAFIPNLRRAVLWFILAIVVQCLSGYWLYIAKLTPNFHWMAFPVQFSFFIAGVVVYHIYKKIEPLASSERAKIASVTAIVVVTLLWLGGFFGIYEIRMNGWPGMRPIIGYLLAALILALALCPFPLVVNRATVYLGEISYGVYLIHPQMIRIVGKPSQEALAATGISAGQISILVICAVLGATIAMASLSYHLLERPVMRLAGRRRINLKAAPAR